MPPRRAKKGVALQTITENVTVVEDLQEKGVKDVLQMIQNIENEVEERVSAMMSTTEDIIVSLKNNLKASIVRLPKKTRDMLLSNFQKQYPEDFKTGAIQEIRERFAVMAEEAAQAVPPATTTSRGMKKRKEEESIAVARSVKPKLTRPSSRLQAGPLVDMMQSTRPLAVSENIAPLKPTNNFNGMPLQTPLPFAGEALPLPFTMIAQKRGGRTRAAPAPDAAVITTADGMQWAVGKDGMASIPETHRAEIEGMIHDQLGFLMKALGKPSSGFVNH